MQSVQSQTNKGIKVGFVSLGCPKNLLNTERMLAQLANAGYEIVPEDVDADIVVVNTCAFIKSAKEEAIENILDVAWLKKNRSLRGIVAAGCLAQRYQEEMFKQLPEIDCMIGTGSIENIVTAVENAYNGTRYQSFGDIDEQSMGGERVVTTPEYTAYIQLGEGCDNFCTYCVIPHIRGRFRSRPMQDIVDEAKGLAELGVKELSLVAQDTTRYGEDLYGEYSLDKLLIELCKIEKLQWIRLLYCYPDRITDSLIDTIAANEKIVKYIEMPIQHINNRILKAMNRRDNADSIKATVAKLRAKIPGLVIRSTVIVGFPGETADEFEELFDFIREVRFERLGAFTYSREEGTPAYSLPNQVNEATKKKRCDRLMSLQQRLHNDYNQSFLGKKLTILSEGYDPVSECYFGRSFADTADIDGKVYFRSKRKIADGEFVEVAITELLDYDLLGEA